MICSPTTIVVAPPALPVTALVFQYAVDMLFRLQVGHPVHVLVVLEGTPAPLIHGEFIGVAQHQKDWAICLIRSVEDGVVFEVYVPVTHVRFGFQDQLGRQFLQSLLHNDFPPYAGPPTMG